jgi:hypothetical protein
MAVFQYDKRSLRYQTAPAPFAADLILLQESKSTPESWRPVIEELTSLPAGGGRVVTCEWFDPRVDAGAIAEDFARLVLTLSPRSLHVVALGDAVDMILTVEKSHPSLCEKTLLFPGRGPQGEELKRAIRNFCHI